MARRRTRRRAARNPIDLWKKIVLVALGLTTTALVGVFVVRKIRRRALPAGPEGAGLSPFVPPLVAPVPPASGTIGDLCEGPGMDRYPGFVWDGTNCVPGDTTPAGIYLSPDCMDFIFQEGTSGPQADFVAQQRKTAASAHRKNDPVDLAAAYLMTFWPECSWPPSPTDPVRIVQLFMALSFVLGREILIDSREQSQPRRRGRVLGQNDSVAADEAVAARLAELGLVAFDPSVVPEIVLPEVPAVQIPGFTPPEQPGPTPGGITPDGEFPTPGQVPGVPPPPPPPQEGIIQIPKPACMTDPHTQQEHRLLSPAAWQGRTIRVVDVAVIDAVPECHRFRLVVGVCMRTRAGASYGLMDWAVAGWPIKGVDNLLQPIPSLPAGWENNWREGFKIQGWDPDTDIPKFALPGTYKKSYRLTVESTPEGTFVDGQPEGVFVPGLPVGGHDACPQHEARWIDKDPTVTGLDGVARQWRRPKVSFTALGKRIQMKIEYSGLPRFTLASGQPQGIVEAPLAEGFYARVNTEDSFDLYTNGWWIGLGN